MPDPDPKRHMNAPAPRPTPSVADWTITEAAKQPESTISLDNADAALFVALAKAQQQVVTVGKDETNEHLRKNYASAEAVIRASRAAMVDCGLSFVTGVSIKQYIQPDYTKNQWPCAVIEKTFVLAHADGGYIRGAAQTIAIEGKQRPVDKAVAAASTYLHGYILRDLLNMDKAEEDKIAVDQREEGTEDTQRVDKPRRKATPREDSEKTLLETFDRYLFETADERHIGVVLSELLDYALPNKPSVENFREATLALESAIADAKAAQEPPDDKPTTDKDPSEVVF